MAIGVLIIGATVGTGIPVIDNTAEDISDFAERPELTNDTTTTVSDREDVPMTTNTGKESAGGGRDARGDIDRDEIERQIHAHINRERAERGLSTLEYDQELEQIARYHSEDMASNGYFSHESPGGESMGDRYTRFGYQCQVPTSSNRYATGAENIAYTYAFSRIRTSSGQSVSHSGNETRIAHGIVEQWMNSRGHRENILRSYWRSEGVGIVLAQIDGNTRVYATQNFC